MRSKKIGIIARHQCNCMVLIRNLLAGCYSHFIDIHSFVLYFSPITPRGAYRAEALHIHLFISIYKNEQNIGKNAEFLIKVRLQSEKLTCIEFERANSNAQAHNVFRTKKIFFSILFSVIDCEAATRVREIKNKSIWMECIWKDLFAKLDRI